MYIKKGGQVFKVRIDKIIILVLVVVITIGAVVCISTRGDDENSSIEGQTVDGAEALENMESNEESEGIVEPYSDEESEYLILVNKENPLDEEFEPENLKDIDSPSPIKPDYLHSMEEVAANALNEMIKQAESEEIKLYVDNGYRSFEMQAAMFEEGVSQGGSEEEVNMTLARGAESEHQTGLAVDITCESVEYKVNYEFEDTKEFEWLSLNSHKFGYILRYPEGKEDITGYSYEPWHYRYVGERAAKEIYESGLTLEEFLEII